MDWHDRGTCILFGDGAGAIVLTAEEQETKACEKIHSDGEKGVSLTCEKGTYLQMDGRAVFQFALSRVPEVIREVLKEAEVPVEEIDAFILHQANSRIIDGVAKRLKAPKEKFRGISKHTAIRVRRAFRFCWMSGTGPAEPKKDRESFSPVSEQD